MIRFSRYGKRMIGGTAAMARAYRRSVRSMGDSNEPAGFLFGSSSGPANAAQYGGEFQAPAPPRVVTLRVARPVAVVPQLPPIVHPAVTPTRSAFVPTPTPAPASCPSCTSPVAAAAGGAVLAGLLMYAVGLASKERKKKRAA